MPPRPPVPPHPPWPAAPATAIKPVLPPPLTLLYVEDNPVNALLMQAMVQQIGGWAIELYDDPDAAVRRARECRPTLMLLDLHLGARSGLDVLAALRAEPGTATVPCVAVSGDVAPDAIAAALAAGFNGYWTKPLDLHEVARQLAAVAACATTAAATATAAATTSCSRAPGPPAP